ncbi:hypothetical protein B0T26DRAFT_679328 [Lasiosphaeria miniovina]|uniref:F-box domain-containing protein n=1 Tax=Lasiosphaeria miniovina TaxID=1954250 RepID=A0AA40A6D6_9PEZI|nr:uncharacterized protein B0T26DRAFT_679328 [Lasiosphaeria miniovina]KAK0709993.1 hypothetical protein B0T26DRAFT_679328 [Lasiosphaeria miniovina]
MSSSINTNNRRAAAYRQPVPINRQAAENSASKNRARNHKQNKNDTTHGINANRRRPPKAGRQATKSAPTTTHDRPDGQRGNRWLGAKFDEWYMPPVAENPASRARSRRAPTVSEYRHTEHGGPVDFVAAAQHNLAYRRMYHLPESVLIAVIRLLDAVSFECLRRTARRFLRLVYVCRGAVMAGFYPWPVSKPLDLARRQDLLYILARDAYCADCRAARWARNWRARVLATTRAYLHCSACRCEHPACFFTPQQRTACRARRTCVGKTGYVRLCTHETVSWFQLQAVAQKNEPNTTVSYVLAQCRDKSRARPCRQPWTSSFSAANWMPAKHPAQPTLSVEIDPSKRTLTLVLAWSPHLELRRPGGPALTPRTLNERLASLREQQSRFTCPETTPGLKVERRLFDPNGCDCLRFPGLGQLGRAWTRSPVAAKYKRSSTVTRLAALVGAQQQQQTDKSTRCRRLETALAAQHAARVRSLHSRYDSSVTALPCRRGGECLQLNYCTRVQLREGSNVKLARLTWAWFMAIDPESYRITEDMDGFGVYWCRDKACRNFWQYTQSRLRPFFSEHDCSLCPCRGISPARASSIASVSENRELVETTREPEGEGKGGRTPRLTAGKAPGKGADSKTSGLVMGPGADEAAVEGERVKRDSAAEEARELGGVGGAAVEGEGAKRDSTAEEARELGGAGGTAATMLANGRGCRRWRSRGRYHSRKVRMRARVAMASMAHSTLLGSEIPRSSTSFSWWCRSSMQLPLFQGQVSLSLGQLPLFQGQVYIIMPLKGG